MDRIASKKKYVAGLKSYASKGMGDSLRGKYGKPSVDVTVGTPEIDTITKSPDAPAQTAAEAQDDLLMRATGQGAEHEITDPEEIEAAKAQLAAASENPAQPATEANDMEDMLNFEKQRAADKQVDVAPGQPFDMKRHHGIDPNDADALRTALIALKHPEEE